MFRGSLSLFGEEVSTLVPVLPSSIIMIHVGVHSSCDVHGHFSPIVMCGEGLYLPVAGVSTLVVVVVLHSSFHVPWGGDSTFLFWRCAPH